MADLTPQSMRESNLPVVLRAGPRIIITVNKEAYLGTEEKPTTPAQRAAYEKIVHDAILEGIRVSPTLSDEQKEKIKAFAEQSDSSTVALNNFLTRGGNGSDSVGFDTNTLFLRLKKGGEPLLYQYANKSSLPANADIVNESMVFYHELGHLIYNPHLENMQDPAADFIGAAETLLNVPDAEGALKAIADFRTAEGLSAMIVVRDQDGRIQGHFNSTETLGGRAIRAALEIPAERLKELRAMPDEERRQALWIEAQRFDDQLKKYQINFPETKIMFELQKREDSIAERLSDEPNARAYQIAHSLLEENCPYKEGSEEYKILKDYADATKRIYEGYSSNSGETVKPGFQFQTHDNNIASAKPAVIGRPAA